MTPRTYYCLGPLVLDRVVEVDRLPGHDEKAFIKAKYETAGGPPRNVAAALAAWGEHAVLMSPVGDDENGKRLLQSLGESDLGIEGIDLVADMSTATTIIIVDETGEKAILIEPVGEAALAAIGRQLSAIADDMVIANLFHPGAVAAAFGNARSVGARTAIDLELPEIGRWGWDSAFATARPADFVVANTQVLTAWMEREAIDASLEEAAARLAKLLSEGGARCCVTLGGRGVVGCEGDRVFAVPALPVAAGNTTGAGDVFLAALVKTSRSERHFEKAVTVATVAAGLFLQSGHPPWDEVERRARSFAKGKNPQ